jgi:hypothetical protein
MTFLVIGTASEESYIVDFEKRIAIKLQILANFIAKWMEPQSQTDTTQESSWLVYCDGAWGHVRAGAAAIIVSPLQNKATLHSRTPVHQ